MHIGLLTLDFHLEGCASLKEKRQRLSGMRDRFGRNSSLAISESDQQDNHQKSQWTCLALADSRRQTEKLLRLVEDYAQQNLDAVLYRTKREFF